MVGHILASTIKVVTFPVDATNIAYDILTSGDGSKKSRNEDRNIFSGIELVRDAIARAAEDIDVVRY